MMLALSLTFSMAAASSGLLITSTGTITERAKDHSLDDALRESGTDEEKAKRALALAMTHGNGTSVTPVQTWRALKGYAKFDPSVQKKLDAMVPAIPFTTANGAQARSLNGAFEQALLDSGALPITADPSRRKGELKVTWTMRMVDDPTRHASHESMWSIDATATLSAGNPKLGLEPVTAKSKTLVKGGSADKAARNGMNEAAGDLVKAILVAIAKDVNAGTTAPTLKASPRSLEKVASIKERADDGDKKSQAVLDSFPAFVSVDVGGGRGAANMNQRVWEKSIQSALLGVSQGALPLTTEPKANSVRVIVSVEEQSGNVLAAGSLRRYTVKSTAQFVLASGSVLCEVTKLTQGMGSTPEEASAAAAEKTARSVYEALIDEISSIRHRGRLARG